MTNFQYIPYTLIAVGLINAVYRHNETSALNYSYLLIVVGALLFVASRIKALKSIYQKQVAQIGILVLASALILLTLVK